MKDSKLESEKLMKQSGKVNFQESMHSMGDMGGRLEVYEACIDQTYSN